MIFNKKKCPETREGHYPSNACLDMLFFVCLFSCMLVLSFAAVVDLVVVIVVFRLPLLLLIFLVFS